MNQIVFVLQCRRGAIDVKRKLAAGQLKEQFMYTIHIYRMCNGEQNVNFTIIIRCNITP